MVEQSSQNQNQGYGVHDFISEGDTPSYLHLFDFTGLRSSEDPSRVRWGVSPRYGDANHAPDVSVPLEDIVAAPGHRVQLAAKAADPDRDALSFHWWQYHEADSYPGLVELENADARNAHFRVPAERDARPDDPRDPGGQRRRYAADHALSARGRDGLRRLVRQLRTEGRSLTR
jgi:hypothetical protein